MCGCEKCHPGRIFNLYLFFKDLPIFGGRGFCWCVWAFSSCSVWGLLSSYSAQASHCSGFSCWVGSVGSRVCKVQQLQLTGSRAQALVAVAQGLRHPMACRIFLD